MRKFTITIFSLVVMAAVAVIFQKEDDPKHSLTVRQGMDCLANALHATDARCDVNSFILSGPLYIDNSQISGHRFYAKYVQHRKIWFVQSLTYPEECSLAVEKLIRQIENWSVWEEDRPRVPEIHFRRPQTTAHRSTRYTALPQ